MYRVLAVADVSQPQLQKRAATNGRLLDVTADAEGEEAHPANRCLKLVLHGGRGPQMALELHPLPFSAADLLGARLRTSGGEERHGVLLLTPANCRLVHDPEDANATTSPRRVTGTTQMLSNLSDVLLDDDDFAQIG